MERVSTRPIVIHWQVILWLLAVVASGWLIAVTFGARPVKAPGCKCKACHCAKCPGRGCR